MPPDVEPRNVDGVYVYPEHTAFRWLCDSVLLEYPSEAMHGLLRAHRCMSSDHVYRLPARVVDGELIVDKRPLGGSEESLGRFDGDVLVAPGPGGTEFDLVWVSPENPISLLVDRGLHESRRGFYPAIPECEQPVSEH